MALPTEIENAITSVDRRHDAGVLPDADTPTDKYDVLMKRSFSDCQVVNITEFDYGRSYRYLIVMSRDPDAAALDRSRLALAVRRAGAVLMMKLAISCLADYYLVGFSRYEWTRGEVTERVDAVPVDAQEALLHERLTVLLAAQGLKELAPTIAASAVPDVHTELCDVGEATVADCLFFG